MEPEKAIRKNVKESCQAQVESFLLNRITSGAWTVGEKIPSERDLAEQLSVSRITVRNAVLSLTSRGFFERSIGQGTFVRRSPDPPDGPARSKPSTGTLGYIVCKEKSVRKPIGLESFYFDIFSGIEEKATRAGFHTLFTYVDDFDREETEVLRNFLGKVDGVVVQEARDRAFLEFLRGYGLPVVLLAPSEVLEGLDFITMDLAAGARTAVRYLRALGHERIGIVNGPLRLESARIRFQAWQEVMRESGLPYDGTTMTVDNDEWTAEAGYTSMKRLLDRNSGLTAVFCANDLLAIGALSALYERSLRVPDDVSVIGFDDTELSRHAAPPLTTMKIYSREMAKAAVKRLLDRMNEPELPPVRIEFPIELIERKSCKEVNGKG